MSRIFGEILEPESRAFWDDEELESSQFQYYLRWVGENTMPSAIKNFLIVEGNVVSDFTRLCSIGETREICAIEHGRLKPSLIYKISNDLYACFVSPDLDARHATEFTPTINNFLLNADQIITITCQHFSSYKSEDMPSSPSLLRSLSTKNSKFFLKDIKRIKQPNLVSGITAGVMSYSEVMELPAIMYVLYVEDFILDSETAVPLIKLFTEIPNSLIHKPVFRQSSFSNKGNLFM